ncbi:MAG: glycosyltransferase [Acidobacteria bacterium]|nr:glycosyltransferase [Acidobacteriota bacterium]
MSNSTRERPFISVIVPFRNNENDIETCCASLMAQRYPADRYEIIFVNNNSTDASRSIVARFPHIQMLEESRPGAYFARNCGLAQAHGSVIAFTDADCIAAPDWLDSIAAAMDDPIAAILLGSYTTGSARFHVRALSAYENAKNRYIFSSLDESLYYGYTNNMAVRRDVFARLGPFPCRMRGGDAMLVRKQVRAQGVRTVRFLPGMRVEHLEFQSIFSYYRKAFIHSRSIRAFRALSPLRVLSNRERMKAFRAMTACEGYSSLQSLIVFCILAGGLVAWLAGWLSISPEDAGAPEGRHEGLGQTPEPQRAGERRGP